MHTPFINIHVEHNSLFLNVYDFYQFVMIWKFIKLKNARLCIFNCIFKTEVLRFKVSAYWLIRPTPTAMMFISQPVSGIPFLKFFQSKLKLHKIMSLYLISFCINRSPTRYLPAICRGLILHISFISQPAFVVPPFWKVL